MSTVGRVGGVFRRLSEDLEVGPARFGRPSRNEGVRQGES